MTSEMADALLAIARSDHTSAEALARAAARSNPGNRLAELIATHLSSAQGEGVYDEPSAFEDFIDHGGNPALYAAVIDALRERYDVIEAAHSSERALDVLDIGCGDGRVTAAAVPSGASLHLLEPAAQLLRAAEVALGGHRGPVTSSQMTRVELLASSSERWDVAQSSFAMSAIEPDARRDALRTLRDRADRLLIVEFDIPDFEDGSAAHAAYAAERYERGVAEYADRPHVCSGFLMPVLVGQFDPGQPRHTYEQSADAWLHDLRATGWTADATPVAPYWWADAVLVDAKPGNPSMVT